MNTKKLKGNLLLLLTAFIWGTAFAFQKSGGYIGAFTYNGVRTLLGAAFLVPVIFILDRVKKSKKGASNTDASTISDGAANANAMAKNDASTISDALASSQEKKPLTSRQALLRGGLFCGIAMFLGSNLQQIGLALIPAGKSGFITSIYSVLVPIFALFLGKKVRPILWFCLALAMAGMYLLCMTAGAGGLSLGDLVTLLCAVAFAFQIMIVDHYAPLTDPVKLSCLQFFVGGALSIPFMLIFEVPSAAKILAVLPSLLYTGIMSTGVAYTLQIIGQRDADPTEATLILCMESVFSVLGGAVLLHEVMKGSQYAGCLLIFSAVVLSNLPDAFLHRFLPKRAARRDNRGKD